MSTADGNGIAAAPAAENARAIERNGSGVEDGGPCHVSLTDFLEGGPVRRCGGLMMRGVIPPSVDVWRVVGSPKGTPLIEAVLHLKRHVSRNGRGFCRNFSNGSRFPHKSRFCRNFFGKPGTLSHRRGSRREKAGPGRNGGTAGRPRKAPAPPVTSRSDRERAHSVPLARRVAGKNGASPEGRGSADGQADIRKTCPGRSPPGPTWVTRSSRRHPRSTGRGSHMGHMPGHRREHRPADRRGPSGAAAAD
jgi:hypothetical protein